MGMAEPAEQTVAKAEAATQRAEAAAVKAEKAAKRPGYLLAAGFLFALVGAVLAFALEESDVSALGVSLESLGGVLLASGALLVAGAAIAPARFGGGSGGSAGGGAGSGTDTNSIKAIGGLIAVLGGITAVTALTIVTLTKLGSENESTIAVTSSAFGIISAVIGAYLGIKITADSNTKTNEEAKNAAVAEHEVNLAKSQVSAMEEAVKDKDPGLAEEAKTAGQEAREKVVAQTIRPPLGGVSP
jgi:hypothetical protein